MCSKLLIINQPPSPQKIDKMNRNLKDWLAGDIYLNIFFTGDGVFWLESSIWEKIYQPSCIYYADAYFAGRAGFRVIPEIIFSGEVSLRELQQNASAVYRLEEL